MLSPVPFILDANLLALVFSSTNNIIQEHFSKKSIIGIAGGKKYMKELSQCPNIRRKILVLNQAGLFRLNHQDDAVNQCEKDLLKGKKCKSDDQHIVALGIVSLTKRLITHDNLAMHDFKKICSGKIFDPIETSRVSKKENVLKLRSPAKCKKIFNAVFFS